MFSQVLLNRWSFLTAAILAVFSLSSSLVAAEDPVGPPVQAAKGDSAKGVAKDGPSTTEAGKAADAGKTAETGTKGKFAPVLPPKDYSPPVLVLAETSFDFGTVFKGEEVIHKFTVENTGGSDLLLNKIKPSCGCTYVDHDKKIAPGAKGIVTLKVNTSKLRPGKQAKRADIFSNDPKNPKQQVTIKGVISTAFKAEPAAPRFEILRGVKSTQIVKLTKTSKMEFKIKEVKTQNQRVAVELKEIKADQEYELLVTANPDEDNKNPYLSDRIIIEVEGADGRTMSQDIPVTIRFKDIVSVTPRTLYFRRNEVKPLREKKVPTITKVVTVKSEGGEDHVFKITGVEVTEKAFKTKLETVKEGKEYKITVELDALPEDATVRSLKSDLKITTDEPSKPEISMRVLAFI
jgi:hypothetical protein